jgi:hypothetical protein
MKILLLTFALFLTTFGLQAQFSVLMVDDDNNTTRESATIDTALAHKAGITYSTLLLDSLAPTYDQIKDYDMIIWTTANDGVDLKLWDTDDTTTAGIPILKFNDALMQYVDSGKVLWIDGLDFMYDIYGGAPDTFASGDFVYDVMGIQGYLAQSKVGDVVYTGVPKLLKDPSNNITSLDSIRWKFSTLWYCDGFALAPTAHSLYVMGPSNYDYYGMTSFLYNYNVISSTARIGTIGNGSALVQSDIDLLISDMIDAAQNGTFAPKVNALEITQNPKNYSLFPNPTNGALTISGNNGKDNTQISIYDLGSKLIFQQNMSHHQHTIDVRPFTRGMYILELKYDNKRELHKLIIQ